MLSRFHGEYSGLIYNLPPSTKVSDQRLRFRISIQLHQYENKFFGMSNLYAKSLEPK